MCWKRVQQNEQNVRIKETEEEEVDNKFTTKKKRKTNACPIVYVLRSSGVSKKRSFSSFFTKIVIR